MPTIRQNLVRCHDCDLLQRGPALQAGQSARCVRCGAVLYRERRDSLDRTLSLAVAALLLWVVANAYAFMTFAFEGRAQSNFIVSGPMDLWSMGYQPLAALVLFASVVAPVVYLSGLLWALVPLRLGWTPWGLAGLFRFLGWLQPWAMLEVYLLGVLVAIVKLSQLASIEASVGLWAFGALIIVWSAVGASLDPRVVWDAVETKR